CHHQPSNRQQQGQSKHEQHQEECDQQGPQERCHKAGFTQTAGIRCHTFYPTTSQGRRAACQSPCATIFPMSQAAQAITRQPADVVKDTPVSQAANGICYAVAGDMTLSEHDLERMISAVPRSAAAALSRKAYYFVPLTVSQGEETVIADRYDVTLADNAVCHRNLNLGDAQCVFISTRLMDDKFSVAFEFYINVGHAIVDRAGVS